jgi:hypothetical protein
MNNPLDNRIRPILTHSFSIEIETQLSKNEARDFLHYQINAGRLNTRYSQIQEIWPNFGGAKINIK